MPTPPTDSPPVARDAAAPRTLLREAMTATLSTIDADTGHPFGSLVALATAADGTPLLLLSKLARHTRNLEHDARASLLIASAAPEADVLTAPRVTLVGRACPTARPDAGARYLARHPEAEGYAGFADFAFYELTISTGHLVAGFGRIRTLQPADVLIDVSAAGALLAAEAEIVAHMNADHADAVDVYARACGVEGGPVRITGIDPGGIDLRVGSRAIRLDATAPLLGPADARKALAALVLRI